MDGLSIFLPPFSPDYSGAASVLFGLGSMIVLHDADGCTCNYASFDEPRWYGTKTPVYSSGLREIDAVLGNDDKFIRRIEEAASDLKPEIITVVGSPVPMVIGTDMHGIANEIEEVTGIPTFGFSTTGVKYYTEGASEAFLRLAKRFMKKTGESKVERSVNIIGLTPLDFGRKENVTDMKQYLQAQGFNVLATLMMETSLDSLKNAVNASVNLVVSSSGLSLAKWMEEKFAIPYVVGVPMKGDDIVIGALCDAMDSGISNKMLPAENDEEAQILWIGEQVQGNSLRNYLSGKYGINGMVVASPFGMIKEICSQGDVSIIGEAKISCEMNKDNYKIIIADPLLKPLLKDERVCFLEVPQVAVSSKLYWDKGFLFQGEDMTLLVEKICDVLR